MSIFPPGTPTAIGNYAAASLFFTAAASATDFGEISGSASKIIEIYEVAIGYGATSAGGATVNDFFLIKRSTAGSGGTATTLTNVPLDSTSAAATAVCRNFTVNPTPGTSVGLISLARLGANMPSGPVIIAQPHIIFKADLSTPPIILRGVAEKLVLNNNGVTIAGSSPLVQVQFKWREVV